MKICIKDKVLVDCEKERIVAVLQMRKPDGSLMFPDGLEVEEISQQLVGVGCGNFPHKDFSDRITEAVNSLIADDVFIESKVESESAK